MTGQLKLSSKGGAAVLWSRKRLPDFGKIFFIVFFFVRLLEITAETRGGGLERLLEKERRIGPKGKFSFK